MKRHILYFMLAALVLAVPAGVALASPVMPTPTPSPTVAPSTQQQARLNRLKTHGGSEIDRRLDNLQKAFGKVTLSTKLAADDKKAIETQLQTEINTLIALKSRLSGETDLIAARQDVQSIVNEYSIYGLLYPKSRLIATADRFMAAGEKYHLVRANLQHKITAAKQQGKDVTQLQTALDDMRAKLADAEARYKPLPAAILDAPKDYIAAHLVLTAQRDGLKVARTNFKLIRDDTRVILTGLRNLKNATPTPSPTASSSPAP